MLGEKRGKPVEHRASRPGHDQKPEQRSENVMIGIADSLLDRELRQLFGGCSARVDATPRCEALAGGDRVAGTERVGDRAERMAEMTESDQHIQDCDVPDQRQQGMEAIEAPVHGSGDRNRG